MKLLTLYLFLHHAWAQLPHQDCVIQHSTENMWEQKLVQELKKCGYNYFTPPSDMKGIKPLQLKLHFGMKSFKFNSKTQEFSTSMWTTFWWIDERLKWDPAKYDGVQTITTSNSLWIPAVRLINNIDDNYDFRYIYTPCEINSMGKVFCVAWIVYNAKCNTDLRDWPYDVQHCSLEFGCYHENGVLGTVQLNTGSKAVTMIGSEYGTEWDIMDYQQITNVTSEKQLIMKFRLERHAEVLASIVIFPSLILSMLTLSALFIDARLDIRLIMICFSLMCHYYYLTDLPLEIPENAKDPPRLLMYFRGSFVLTSVVTVLSFVLSIMCKKEVACPNWIIYINDLFTKIGRFIIWPRWQTTINEESCDNFVKNWTDFANIVNTVCIFTSMIVYVSLYYVFIPQPIPFN